MRIPKALKWAVMPVVALFVATACGAGSPSSAAAGAQANPVHADVYLTIVTGGMIGKDNYPAMIPSNVTLPANATVTVHVLNFDDPDDMSAASLVQYTKATGVVGNQVTVQPIKDDDPNTLGTATTSSQLDPKTGVSHTITIPQLHLNVPIAPHAVTTFVIQTGAAGTYAWQCMVPCGTGSDGMQGPMIENGYMKGTLTVS